MMSDLIFPAQSGALAEPSIEPSKMKVAPPEIFVPTDASEKPYLVHPKAIDRAELEGHA